MANRPYLDASIMRPIYEKYQRSNQTIKSFCTAEGIKVHTFTYWRHKFIKMEQSPAAVFSEISVPPKHFSGSSIILRLGGQVELELPADYPVACLSQLLTQLAC